MFSRLSHSNVATIVVLTHNCARDHSPAQEIIRRNPLTIRVRRRGLGENPLIEKGKLVAIPKFLIFYPVKISAREFLASMSALKAH
jgi:hypothetical protein